MKVKLLWSHFLPDLDKKINEFIQGKKIIDIKFTEVVSDDYGKGDWSALVMYEEKETDTLNKRNLIFLMARTPTNS